MADSLRAVVRSIDSQLALTQVESMDRVVEEGQVSRRFNTAFISAFASAAVLLALLGIYSVMAISTALRAQKMAIRMALGSQRSGIARLVLFSGSQTRRGRLRHRLPCWRRVCFGRCSLRSIRWTRRSLPWRLYILLIALAASGIPAGRAASIDPVEALRAE